MKEPVWIDSLTARVLHEKLISRFGGLPGVRNESLLDSALHRARQAFTYGSPALFEMAASYAFGIAKNHPFLDGNKRMAFLTAAVFLETNGYLLAASEEEAVIQTVALAAGRIGEDEYAMWLKKSCQKKKV